MSIAELRTPTKVRHLVLVADPVPSHRKRCRSIVLDGITRCGCRALVNGHCYYHAKIIEGLMKPTEQGKHH